MNIVIIAFNYAHAGKAVNGPGMCLENFCKILHNHSEHRAHVFTEITNRSKEIYSIHRKDELVKKIKSADLVIHWSGLTGLTEQAIKFVNKYDKRLIAGPNLFDTVNLPKEQRYVRDVKFDKIITVSERLKYLIMKTHDLPLSKVDTLIIGPDLDAWLPTEGNDGTILWKGNSKQFVKDIDFALQIKERLKGKYKFKFIGYPDSYEYRKHILDAKRSKLYISTSLSETMGLGLTEQWAAGIPSVTHPKIYMHGINYFTGIITSRTVGDYCEAIEEIMEDDALYRQLSLGARKFAEEKFSPETILRSFERIVS